MTKAQRAACDRLIAYAQRPDAYYPPTPEECRTAYELIEAMENALRTLVAEGYPDAVATLECAMETRQGYDAIDQAESDLHKWETARAILERPSK